MKTDGIHGEFYLNDNNGDAMERKKHERVAQRSSTKADITCQPYVSSREARISDGIMRNFSSSGSYVEISGKFVSGTILVMRMLNCPPVTPTLSNDSHPRTICLAEVKWCRELAEENDKRYGMGLKYLV